MSDIYSTMILELYKHPRNKKRLEAPDLYNKSHNPLCGDQCEIFAKLKEGETSLDQVTFDGQGCAISIASASILTKLTQGLSLEEALSFDREELLESLGIKLSPNRLKCALLALDTLKNAVRKHQAGDIEIKTE